MHQLLKQPLDTFGFLRLSLLGLALVNTLLPSIYSMLAALSRSTEHSAAWSIVPDVVAPVMAPLLLVVIFIDYVMSRVRVADEQGEPRQRFLLISRVELCAMGLMLLAWIPFFVALSA